MHRYNENIIQQIQNHYYEFDISGYINDIHPSIFLSLTSCRIADIDQDKAFKTDSERSGGLATVNINLLGK